MASTARRTVAQALSYEIAVALKDKIAAQFAPMLSDKNSWGVESNTQAAASFGHPVFDVMLCGQSQEPLREKIGAYVAGLLSQKAADDGDTE